MQPAETYTFYTDGGCDNAGTRQGSFAWFRPDTGEAEAKYFDNTTSNIMEMSAVISALEKTPEGVTVHIYSDSEYTIKGITEWIVNWKRRGWRNAKKEPVKNKALWVAMDELCSTRQVFFHKVKAHSGVFANEVADSLCNAAAFHRTDLSQEQIRTVIQTCKEQYHG